MKKIIITTCILASLFNFASFNGLSTETAQTVIQTAHGEDYPTTL